MGQFTKIWKYFCFAGVLFITGCSTISTEDGTNYSTPMEEQYYRNRETFDHIYALQKEKNDKPITTAVVFDFKNDVYTIQPGISNNTNDTIWDTILDDDMLNSAMDNVRDSKAQVITIKPCSDCERIAVGTIYSDRSLKYSFKPDDMTVTFNTLQFPSTKGG